jgi:hypothetical protein
MRLLSDDHRDVDEVLQQLLRALDNKDVQAAYAKLDLLWARLAVHIRAEHLHLFPAVASKHRDAESVIETLRADHDFFMVELARAIGIVRDGGKPGMIAATVREVENRLISHNELEETQIYHWADTMLTEPEQIDLATRINAELEKRPPRFSAECWKNTHAADTSVL